MALLASLALAALSVLLAAAAGPPYLDLSALNGWILVFAIAAFAALFAVPFAINRALVGADPDRAEAWEPAMVVWGLVAAAALGLGALMVWAGDFTPSGSLDDAVGLLLVVEAGMVLLALAVWALSG